jgi:hypothetical protein
MGNSWHGTTAQMCLSVSPQEDALSIHLLFPSLINHHLCQHNNNDTVVMIMNMLMLIKQRGFTHLRVPLVLTGRDVLA